MVQYHVWIGAVRAAAKAQGADLRDFEANSNVVSVGADIWNDRKEEIRKANAQEARAIADEEISVS